MRNALVPKFRKDPPRTGKAPLPPDEERDRIIKGLKTRVRNLAAELRASLEWIKHGADTGMNFKTMSAIAKALHPDRKPSEAERAEACKLFTAWNVLQTICHHDRRINDDFGIRLIDAVSGAGGGAWFRKNVFQPCDGDPPCTMYFETDGTHTRRAPALFVMISKVRPSTGRLSALRHPFTGLRGAKSKTRAQKNAPRERDRLFEK